MCAECVSSHEWVTYIYTLIYMYTEKRQKKLSPCTPREKKSPLGRGIRRVREFFAPGKDKAGARRRWPLDGIKNSAPRVRGSSVSSLLFLPIRAALRLIGAVENGRALKICEARCLVAIDFGRPAPNINKLCSSFFIHLHRGLRKRAQRRPNAMW